MCIFLVFYVLRFLHEHIQETAETIVYTNVGLLPNIQSQFPENSLDFDEHRVKYAQLNHKAQASVPTLMKEKSTDEGIP